MKWSEVVYREAPVALQHVMVSAYGWHWKRLRFGGNFESECRKFLERERFSQDQWAEYSQRQLRALMLLAFEQVPYYRALWQSVGLIVSDIEHLTPADLRHLPVLEKTTARDEPLSLLLGGEPHKHHHVFHTSGSSGTPVATYWLPGEMQRSLALRETRSCKFAGVSYRMARATFSGRIVEPDPESRGPYYRFNWFEKQVYFSAFHLRPEAARTYVRALHRHRPVWMTGYSNSIFQLAQMILDQQLSVPGLKAVITTSEKLTPEMRETIERAFCTRVFEEYGTVEDLFYVCECEEGCKHISPDAGLLEVVNDRFEPVEPGEMGEVLATGFIRPSQPMIRYRIGDFAVLDDQRCPCGRHMPVLKEVVGRLEDTIYGPDGRRMVRFHGISIGLPSIQEAQIVQERLDHVRVRVVVKPGYSFADSQEIVQRVQQRLTAQVKVTVEQVARIERTASGKFKAVVCNLPQEDLDRLRQQ